MTGFGEVFGEKPGADTERLVTEIVDWITTGRQQQTPQPPVEIIID